MFWETAMFVTDAQAWLRYCLDVCKYSCDVFVRWNKDYTFRSCVIMFVRFVYMTQAHVHAQSCTHSLPAFKLDFH